MSRAAGWQRCGVAGLWLLLAGCTAAAELERPASMAFIDTAETALGRQAAALVTGRPGRSGIAPLGDPGRTFATLSGLARAAERSLDLQYYAWHADTTGWLLLHEVWEAAERGVRVRLLLDDLHTVGLDWPLFAMDAHPLVEVRLFNPFRFRYLRLFDLLGDFLGSNQRMHNKSFIADNQVAVLGGRNIGDSYFGAEAAISFADLDILAVGPVVQAVSDQFDRYWNDVAAVSAGAVIRPHAPPPGDYLERTFAERSGRAESLAYLAGLDAALLAAPVPAERLVFARATLLVDPPAKIRGVVLPAERLIPQLMAVMGVPEERLDIVSAYLVLSPEWSAVFSAWARRGVAVRVLTNSLAGIDVGLAHVGHARRRRSLLVGGVEVWEMKPGLGVGGPAGSSLVRDESDFAGSGGTLHAKAAALDGRRLFVGSLNLDQRSAYLNTEMGIVVESPRLADDLHALFDERLAAVAYQLVLDDAGRLNWLEHGPDGVIRHEQEPGAGLWRSLTAGFGALLPIDWLL